LETGSCFLSRVAGTSILLFYASHIAGMAGTCQHTKLFLLGWGLANFFAQTGLEPQYSQSQPPK
jgi:hypothetical protein